jgi:tRNA modification GTPase
VPIQRDPLDSSVIQHTDGAEDTIAAIATPPGAGGIGIVRLSGPRAFAIGRALFRPVGKRSRARPDWTLPSHRLTYGHIVDPATGEPVDEALAAFMRAPHTYTREDVVELNAHGGPLLLRRVLALALAAGARAARPGEMTLRAFLNGRLDLAQAEAVMALIQAESEAGLRLALRQLTGDLSARVRAVREPALQAMVRIEASNDFPEDEVDVPDRTALGALVARARAEAADLLAGAERGRVLREGLRVVILGRPNVGKSSLLNALLGHERAIVTPIAGTTRDTVEEVASVRGIALHLVDTAGLTASQDPIERLGVERSRAAAASADLVLFVLDTSESLTDADRDAAREVRALGFGGPGDDGADGAAVGRPEDAPTDEPGERGGRSPNAPTDGQAANVTIAEAMRGDPWVGRALVVVLNKADLPTVWGEERAHALWPDAAVVPSSSVAPGGTDALEEAIAGLVLGGQAHGADPLVASVRHRDALRRAADALASAAAALANSTPLDFVALDLREALDALGEITGETATGDLLDRIFAEFCIGK